MYCLIVLPFCLQYLINAENPISQSDVEIRTDDPH
jgi:hypothetical protein